MKGGLGEYGRQDSNEEDVKEYPDRSGKRVFGTY
jgi:hypothetical protein